MSSAIHNGAPWLFACEESQACTIEFRKRGVEAYSADLLPCSGGHPEWHIQGDVLPLLKKRWAAVVAFPPCTHLAVSGAAWFEEKRKDGRQQQGIDFFLEFTKYAGAWSIENPVGIMSTFYRKPDQLIQPYFFGDPVKKTTCLWLNGLPPLKATNIVEPDITTLKTGARFSTWDYKISMNHKERARLRSKTFPGIAQAMAEQWSKILTTNPQ